MRKAGSGAPGQNRPAVFAFTGPKPPLGRLHQNDRNTAKDPRGFSPSRVSTDHSGASSVASAWGIRWGATPRGHNHTNTHSHDQPPKGTFLLCWERGPFHFALTLYILQKFASCVTSKNGKPTNFSAFGTSPLVAKRAELGLSPFLTLTGPFGDEPHVEAYLPPLVCRSSTLEF
jgi:hypothetical protein